MTEAMFPRIEQDSRRQQVVQALRDMIVSGRLRPNDRLVEADISEQMGVSRGPVREALRQLEQEGLVISYPYRGTMVLGISKEEVEQVLVPIRLTLEHFSFRHALSRLDESDYKVLEELIHKMQEAADNDDDDQLAEGDVRFHEYVIQRSQQTHCIQIWQTIAPRVFAYFRQDATARRSPLFVVQQHIELLEVLRARDEQKLLAVLDAHISTYVHPEQKS